jgi:hypothetical protein
MEMEDRAPKVQAKPHMVVKSDQYGALRTTTNIGNVIGLWFGYATAIEVAAGLQNGAKKSDDSAVLGFIPGFTREVAIPTYAITSTVLYATSAILKAAYKL